MNSDVYDKILTKRKGDEKIKKNLNFQKGLTPSVFPFFHLKAFQKAHLPPPARVAQSRSFDPQASSLLGISVSPSALWAFGGAGAAGRVLVWCQWANEVVTC